MTETLALPTIGGPTSPPDIEEFIYLLGHDLGASVRALKVLPQWIADDLEEAGVAVPDPVTQSIEMMNRHSNRLDRMLKDLLVHARIGRMQDIARIHVETALDMALAGLHLPAGMALTRDIGCGFVWMGRQDSIEIWRALIGNAIKHHHSQTGTIEVATRGEGEMIRFTIRDDGPGISEHLREKALGAMTTLRSRDLLEGSGMGLANIRKIAVQYGGYVTLSDAAEGYSGLRVDLVIPKGWKGPV